MNKFCQYSSTLQDLIGLPFESNVGFFSWGDGKNLVSSLWSKDLLKAQAKEDQVELLNLEVKMWHSRLFFHKNTDAF